MTQTPPNPLPPRVAAEVRRILDRAARRLFNMELELAAKRQDGTLSAREAEAVLLMDAEKAGTLTEADRKRLNGLMSTWPWQE